MAVGVKNLVTLNLIYDSGRDDEYFGHFGQKNLTIVIHIFLNFCIFAFCARKNKIVMRQENSYVFL